MKRQGHRIVSKRGQKHELDRQNWSACHDFSNMRDRCADEMIDAGIAELIPDPVHMSREGAIADNPKEAFGYEETHRITYPDHAIVADELGGNISQKGDGHVGGERCLCERGSVPKKVSSNVDKHFALLGFTALSGDPVMRAVAFSGANQSAHAECSVDFAKDFVRNDEDNDLFEKNFGPGKALPGGPARAFRGRKVPCVVRWSEKGGISTSILTDALREMDARSLFPRTNGCTPFLLLDGHGSQTELEFLQCANDPKHKWVACLGVPCGTGCW